MTVTLTRPTNDPHASLPSVELIPVSDPDMATVLSLLEDDCTRDILAATATEPLSATELAKRCDVSLPTVTRRLEELVAADLLAEQTRPRPDGHHDEVYMAQLDSVEIRLTDGEYEFTLRREDRDPAAELQKLWNQL